MELVPCCWTDVSEAPSELTRFWTIVVAVAMSSELGVDPSALFAAMMTETPPCMSRPCVMRSPSGVKPTAAATSTTASTTRVLT